MGRLFRIQNDAVYCDAGDDGDCAWGGALDFGKSNRAVPDTWVNKLMEQQVAGSVVSVAEWEFG